jgi:hypothetical protein
MFVFSVKANKPKLIMILSAVAVILIVVVLVIKNADKPVANDGDISYKASNEEERVAFLSQFGWKINEDPIEVTEVIIPSEFDSTYSSYNEIQKNQGLNLEPYKGMRVKKWVYKIENYPNATSEESDIRATILVLDGIVVGGDISSMEVDGFVQGFEFPDESLAATTASSAAASSAN